MRWLIPIFLLISLQSFCQDSDTRKATKNLPLDSLPLPSFEKFDSLSDPANHPFDSLSRLIQSTRQKIQHVNGAPEAGKKYSNKIDSLQRKLQACIDSLSLLPNLDSLLMQDLSSLNANLDSMKSKLSPAVLDSLADKAGDVEAKINASLAKIEVAVNDKLKLFSEKGGNLSGELNIETGVDTAIPSVAMPGENDLNLAEIPGTEDTSLPGVDPNLGQIPGTEMVVTNARMYKDSRDFWRTSKCDGEGRMKLFIEWISWRLNFHSYFPLFFQ